MHRAPTHTTSTSSSGPARKKALDEWAHRNLSIGVGQWGHEFSVGAPPHRARTSGAGFQVPSRGRVWKNVAAVLRLICSMGGVFVSIVGSTTPLGGA